jgi:plasmid maintenance system antidote protein VapI
MVGKERKTREEDPHLVAILKQAIETSGEKLAELARRTGVSTGQLSRFVRGERDLSLGAAAKLVDYFGFQLVRPKTRGK